MTEVYLIGDVGGTNTRLVLYEWDTKADKEVRLAEKIYPSKKYNTLTDALKEFLTTVSQHNNPQPQPQAHPASQSNASVLQHPTHISSRLSTCRVISIAQFSKDRTPTSCCLALAGPVVDNTCIITNLNWHIRATDISTQLRIPHVSLINDFVAAGYGCLALPPASLTPLYTPPNTTPQPATHSTRAVKAIIGAGTGLGEAFAVWDDAVQGYKVYPTEGGHADFAPRNEAECQLLLHVRQRLKVDHVSVERFVSGTGIPNIYAALRSAQPQLTNAAVDAQLADKAADGAAIISQHATNGDALCAATIRLFTSLYGAEAGNLALKTLSLGGVYIAGGVAGKMMTAMRSGEFQRAFVDKGRLGAVVETVPVWLAKGEVGLDGARVVAKRLISEHRKHHRGIAKLTSKL